MKCKRLLSLLLCTILLLPITAQARDMQMYVSGTYLTRDIESIDGFDMVPLLDIAGELGFHSWFDGTTAIIYNDVIKFTFTMHSPAVYDQHGREYGLDIVPQMINGKFMIPAKFFVDHLNMTYTWDSVTDTVFLDSDYTYQWLINTSEYKQAKNKRNVIGTWVSETDASIYGYYNSIIFYEDGTCFLDTKRHNAYGTYHFTDSSHIAVGFGMYLKTFPDILDYRQTCYYELKDNQLKETGYITDDGKTYTSKYIYKKDRVTLYAPDFSSQVVDEKDVTYWTQRGWYTYPVCYIYNSKGEKRVIPESELQSQLNAGWFSDGSIYMYTLDGRKESVPKWQVSAMEKYGWYTEPVIKMFSANGKNCVVKESEISAHKRVGWYEPHELALGKTYNQVVRIFGNLSFNDYWRGGRTYVSNDYLFAIEGYCSEINVPLIQYFPQILYQASYDDTISWRTIEEISGLECFFCEDSHDFGYSLLLYCNDWDIEIPCDYRGYVNVNTWINIYAY